MCERDQLPAQGSVRLDFTGDRYSHGLCVVRRHGRIHAYLNRCPHQQMPMDWQPGRFLDPSGEFIVCATHGARFRVEDGYCVAGPCQGQSLRAVPVAEDAGGLWLLDAAIDAPPSRRRQR